MSKVRQILKLHTHGIGKKKIATRLGMSKNTVKAFHPPYGTLPDPKVRLVYDFFPEMEKQLRKRGVTVALLFRKFRQENPDCFKETAFYGYYRMWKKRVLLIELRLEIA